MSGTEKTIFAKDGCGSIELLGTFGDDLTVVNAARVSFAKESKELVEADKKLIRYLAKHQHITPFFHPQVRFRIKLPIFVAREWFRHTIGFARNEVSRRYVDSPPECWCPAAEDMRERDPKLKQGSKDCAVPEADGVHDVMDSAIKGAMETYKKLLDMKVAPEIARAVLPQSMYTQFVETGSLYAYARLCSLRLDPSAQAEIRMYAGMIADLLRDAFPVCWAALEENFKGAAAIMADQIDRIREEMFAKFEKDEKEKQERIEHAQSQCEHSYTSRSRVSSDGKSQILGCGKCGHKVLKEFS